MWFIFIRWLKGLWIWSHEIMMFEKFWVTLLCLFETDVVYDPDVIACLVRLLSMLLNCKVQEKHPEVYIASTVRNPQTYDCFKKELGRFHINKIIFYSINVKCFLNSWFPIMNEMFFYLQKWLDWDTLSWKILSLKYFNTNEPPLWNDQNMYDKNNLFVIKYLFT